MGEESKKENQFNKEKKHTNWNLKQLSTTIKFSEEKANTIRKPNGKLLHSFTFILQHLVSFPNWLLLLRLLCTMALLLPKQNASSSSTFDSVLCTVFSYSQGWKSANFIPSPELSSAFQSFIDNFLPWYKSRLKLDNSNWTYTLLSKPVLECYFRPSCQLLWLET